jgi:Trk K+ transport system NAD-binding subunit
MPNIQTIEKPANVLNLSNVEITHFVKPTQILGRYIANSILKDGFYFSTEDEKLKEL